MFKRTPSKTPYKRLALILFLCSCSGLAQVGPVQLQVVPGNPILLQSGSQQLQASQGFFRSAGYVRAALPSAAVIWSSSNYGVATVDSNGFVQAVGAGTATVKVQSGPFQGATKVIVTATALTSISISPSSPNIPNGTSAPLIATGTFADSSTLDITNSVTWSSSDITTATTSTRGVCHGRKQGTVTITAAYGNISGSASVTIGPPIVSAISIAPANLQVPIGSVEQFIATATMSDDTQQDVTKTASWSASNQVNINATGLATANALGTATITATAQGVTGNTSWMIFPGTRSKYIRTTFPSLLSFEIDSAVYDPVRKLIFANNLRENKVDVIAGPDYHLAASIPVPFPIGLDLTADGTQLLVCSQQSILAIDPDTLRIIGKTAVPPTLLSSIPLSILTTSAGNAFLVMGNVSSTGAELVEWYPTQGKFVQVRPPHFASFDGGIVRTQDHSKMLVDVAGFHVDLYDSASDQFTATYTSQYDSPFIAANPNGTQFIVGTDVLDSNLTKTGSLQSVPLFNSAVYSRDGSHIYLTDPLVSTAFNIVDSGTLAVVGKVPNIGTDTRPLDIDETGMLIEWFNAGWAMVDVSKAQPLGGNQPSINNVQPPQGILGQSTATTINGAGFTAVPSVWFDSNFSPQVTLPNSNTVQAVAPPLYTPGPINVTTVFPNGWFAIAPDALTIGPHILEILTDGGSIIGGTQVEIIGYGFKFDASQIQVTVGGTPATVTSVSAFPGISPFLFPVHHLKFTTPPGLAGPADVTVQTPAGSTTLANGFQYVNVQNFSNGNLYSQIVYDRSRQQLYLGSAKGKIDVFSLAAQQFLASVVVGGTISSMALAPDASGLLVANSGDNSIDLIDLNTNTVSARITAADSCFNPGSQPQQVVVTSLNKAFITIDSISFRCPAPFTNLRQLDLQSLAIANRDIGGTTFITNVTGMAGTPDGSQVVMPVQNGPDAIWQSSSDTFFTKSAPQGLPFIDADGTVITMNSTILSMQLQASGLAAPSALSKAFDPFLAALNEGLNPSGSLLYGSYGNRVDIYDTGHGTRRRKIAVGLTSGPSLSGPFAVDETGLRIFAPISGGPNGGFDVLTLDSVPLAIGSLSPSQAPAAGGTTVAIRGSGFQQGSTVAFNNTTVQTTWIDQNTLQVITPQVTPGLVRVTVTNPNHEQFSLDTAFQAN